MGRTRRQRQLTNAAPVAEPKPGHPRADGPVDHAWPAGARKTRPVKNPVPGGYTEQLSDAAHWVDVDLESGTLRVRHGKGDRSRTVGVDAQTATL